MKSIVLFILALFVSLNQASANVLDKVQLEEAIQRRLETNLHLYDKDIKIKVNFVYRAPASLPGTTFLENEELSPNTISESDIRGINVEVHTRLSELTSSMQEDIYALIPVRKSRIKIKHIQLVEKPVNVTPPLAAKDFWDISNSFKTDAAQLLLGLVASSVFILSLLFFLIHRSQLRQSRENFNLLAKSIQDKTASSPALNSMSSGIVPSGTEAAVLESSVNATQIYLPVDSLKELFADCYWCEEDKYAHWLWQRTTLEQKKQLLAAWPPLKKYSLYFVSLPAEKKGFHEHPFYISPEALAPISQIMVEKEVKKNPDIWLCLSPLRQLHLKIPISEKLRIVKKDSSVSLPQIQTPSPERVFPRQATLGELSFDDEITILKKPDTVPTNMRAQFQSLVWLSLREPTYIESVLAQQDALSLASAWVSAPEILANLEKHLPEKKLKLLHAYREKVVPSKKSEAYQFLVKAGLYNEAA